MIKHTNYLNGGKHNIFKKKINIDVLWWLC